MLTSISLITNPHVQGWTLWVCHKSVVGRMGIFCSSYHVLHNEELLQIHRVLPNRSAQKTTYSLCPYDRSFPAQLVSSCTDQISLTMNAVLCNTEYC
jgi:hypothetical protein